MSFRLFPFYLLIFVFWNKISNNLKQIKKEVKLWQTMHS